MAAVPRTGRAADGALADRGRPAPAVEPSGMVGRAPIVVLATEYSGAGRLRSLLDDLPGVAFTAGTGILPLCEQAAAVWRTVDGQPDGPPSRLALTSARALADGIIVSLLARTGKRRWCEFCHAMPDTAQTFALLYPGTRFVCLHRSCGNVIRAALDASPWGLADPALVPFVRAYPISTTAALAAYWTAYTQSLLAFEAAHPSAVLRVRFEDLAEAGQTAGAVASFLGAASPGDGTALALDDQGQLDPVVAPVMADLPAGLIPPVLLAQANDLQRQLGYPALGQPQRSLP